MAFPQPGSQSCVWWHMMNKFIYPQTCTLNRAGKHSESMHIYMHAPEPTFNLRSPDTPPNSLQLCQTALGTPGRTPGEHAPSGLPRTCSWQGW